MAWMNFDIDKLTSKLPSGMRDKVKNYARIAQEKGAEMMNSVQRTIESKGAMKKQGT